MQIIADGVAIACGNAGTVLRSTDGGATWAKVVTGTRVALWDIEFVSDLSGWVVGDSGLTLRTTDGGVTWSVAISLESRQFRSLFMFDENNGWVVTYGGEVLQTSDGGNNWGSGLQLDATASEDLLFLNDTVGLMLADSSLHRTVDGGVTWARYEIDTLSWIRNRAYKSLGRSQNGRTSICGGGNSNWGHEEFVVFSDDQGTTWNFSSSPEYFYDIKWIDAQVAVGLNEMGYVYHTYDQGDSWQIDPSVWVGSTPRLDLLNQCAIAVTATSGTMYSDDAAETWRVSKPEASAQILDVVFFTDSIGILADVYAIKRTHDGGKSWTAVQGGMSTGLEDLSEGIVKAVVNHNLMTSSDSGKTWSKNDNLDLPGLDEIRFANLQDGWARGYPAIQCTYDGGMTWSTILQPASTWNCMELLERDTGWVGGANGRILYTVNGGASWTESQFPAQEVVTDLCFLNSETGWCTGTNGLIAGTVDGGLTWTSSDVATTVTLNEIAFVNDTLGIAVGDFGTVVYSTDGGESWFVQYLPTAENLEAIRVSSDNVFYTAGSGEVLFRGTFNVD